MKYIVILFLFLASCSPQKRFQRLIEKNPDLIKNLDTKVIVNDTIIETDTIFIEGATIEVPFNVDSLTRKYTEIYEDSFVSISLAVDSLRELKTKVKVKDRFFTKTDTIYYTKEITVPSKGIVYENKRWMWAFIGSWVLIFALVALYWRR